MKNYMRAILAICLAAAFTSHVSFAQGFGYFNYNHHYSYQAPTSYGYGQTTGYAAPVAYAPAASYAPVAGYAAAPVAYAPAARYAPTAGYAPIGYGQVQAAPTYSLRLVRRYAVRRPRPVVVQPNPCNVCN